MNMLLAKYFFIKIDYIVIKMNFYEPDVSKLEKILDRISKWILFLILISLAIFVVGKIINIFMNQDQIFLLNFILLPD